MGLSPQIRAYLADGAGARAFGPGPAELLRRTAELGSLRAAALSMGMAYTKAHALLTHAEHAVGAPLLRRERGGRGGGGSSLTPEARRLLSGYDAWSRASKVAGERAHLSSFVEDAGEPDGRTLGVVVLAAGHASRFGSNKLLASIDGEPVVGRVLAAVRELSLPCVVVTRHEGVSELCDGLRVIAPEGPLQGHSVAAGAREALRAGWDGGLFFTGDQPLLSPGSLSRLVCAWRREPARVVRLCWRGVAGSPAVFPRALFGGLCELSGDSGGGALLSGLPPASLELVEAAWPWELWDVDTPEDLARCRQVLEAFSGLA